MGLLDGFFGQQQPGQPGMGEGLMGGMNTGVQNNANALMGMGMGLMSGNRATAWQNAMQGYMMGSMTDYKRAQDRKEEAERKEKKERERAFTESLAKLHPDMAEALRLGDTQTATQLLRFKMEESAAKRAQANADRSFGLDSERLNIAKRTEERLNQPKDNWVRAGDGTMFNVRTREFITGPGSSEEGPKLSAGYQWADPKDKTKGMVPVPGGPGEKIDGEIAGRMGLAKKALDDIPKLYTDIQGGALDGATNRAQFAVNAGKPAEVYRRLQSGADALTRLLTGAGMTAEEARQYASRYLPGTADSRETMLSKIRELGKEIRAAAVEAGKGRGGFEPPKFPWDDPNEMRDLGPVTGGAPMRNPTGTAPKLLPPDPYEAELRRRGLLP